MGRVRFGIPKEEVLWLRDQFGLTRLIETGTNKAESTIWASRHFEQVVTVEGHEPLYKSAVAQHERIRNIQFVLGDSPDYLRRLVPTLLEPALFWLDAHWCGPETHGLTNECPVLAELRALNESSVEHFILIDDARLFLAPPPAPHNAAHWPSIGEICDCLAKHPSDRYAAVFEDVIYCVPRHAREKLVDHLQRLASPYAPAREVGSGLVTRARRRLAGLQEILTRRSE